MSTDIPEDQRISDEDIFNQISTFLFAGSDTSSLTITWTLYLLAKHPEIQTRLREEMRQGMPDPSSSSYGDLFSALDRLSLLDMVVRESLRLIPPLHSSLRVATEDDVIPVSAPITMRDGTRQSGIRISKGQFIHVAIEEVNLDRAAWGPTAWDFEYVPCLSVVLHTHSIRAQVRTDGWLSRRRRGDSQASIPTC